jgi:ammonium transporter, Amt family
MNVTELKTELEAIIQPGSLVSNQVSEIGLASTGFIIICSALVMLMTPGVGLLYSGLSRTKNALIIVMISFLAYAVVAVQWVIFGFSFSFSETGSPFIGNFAMAGFSNVFSDALPSTTTTIPVIVFALYQLQFAAVTLAIIFGSVTERVRLIPSIVFMFFWTTLVYNPVTYWTWASRGWLKNLSCLETTALDQTPCGVGDLDFAGGGPVHMASGAAALAFCIFLGHRKRMGHDSFKPHNVTNVFLGTALLWFGWFGFNAGSALAANARAGMAGFVTTISASAGGLAWVICDYLRIRKLSGIGFCSGVIAGLVGITPAAGYVAPWASIVIGAVTGVTCCFAIRLKDILGFDDALDAFGLHGVGGFVGAILTALFASKELVFSLDGTEMNGGAIDGNWVLLGYNLAGAVSTVAYSFVVTLIILYLINMIPHLHFRPNEEDEHLGGDLGEMGEVAYELLHPYSSDHKDLKAQSSEETVEA